MIEEKIMVSVCMITYNHENYISEAIEGVLMQKTSFPIELVIGEDCSSDRTREICLEYAAKYPKIIRLLPNNKRLGMNRNFQTTADALEGKYVAICDGDDYWVDPLKLQKQIDLMEVRTELSLVYTKTLIINEKKRIRKTRNSEMNFISNTQNSNFDFQLRRNRSIVTSSVLCRKKDFTKSLKNISRIPFQTLMLDMQIWLELSKVGEFYHMPEVTTVYRLLENSASSRGKANKRVLFLENSYHISKWYLERYKSNVSIKELTKLHYKTRVIEMRFYAEPFFLKYVKDLILTFPSSVFSIRFLGSFFIYILTILRSLKSNN